MQLGLPWRLMLEIGDPAWHSAGEWLAGVGMQPLPSMLAVRPTHAELSWAAAPAAWWVGLLLFNDTSPFQTSRNSK